MRLIVAFDEGVAHQQHPRLRSGRGKAEAIATKAVVIVTNRVTRTGATSVDARVGEAPVLARRMHMIELLRRNAADVVKFEIVEWTHPLLDSQTGLYGGK